MTPIFNNKIPTKAEELLMASIALQDASQKIQQARDCLIGHDEDYRKLLFALLKHINVVQNRIEKNYKEQTK